MGNTETCLECEECTYIGEGAYFCHEVEEVVIEEFGQPTINWMLCQKKGG